MFDVNDQVHLGAAPGKVLRRHVSANNVIMYDVLLEDGLVHENILHSNVSRMASALAASAASNFMRNRYRMRRSRYQRRRGGAGGVFRMLHYQNNLTAMDYFWAQQDVRIRERHAYRDGVLDATLQTYGTALSPPNTATTTASNEGGGERSETSSVVVAPEVAPTDATARMEHDSGAFTQHVRGQADPPTEWYTNSSAWSDPTPSSSTTNSWSSVIRSNLRSSSTSSSSGWSSSSSSSNGGGASGSW